MRYMIAALLCGLLSLVHIQLWWGESSSHAHAKGLAQELRTLQAQNEQIRFQNAALKAELKDLQGSTEV
ncbi:MAG: FtsB family cell division protein, partial [Saezia sp.]